MAEKETEGDDEEEMEAPWQKIQAKEKLYLGIPLHGPRIGKRFLQSDAKCSNVGVLERYDNMGPTVDFCGIDLEKQGQNLIVSFISETRILAMNTDDELEENEIEGFCSQVQTLFCHDVGHNQLDQGTSSTVRVVLLTISGRHVVYLEIGDDILTEPTHAQLKYEISCFDINSIREDLNDSHLAAVEIWAQICAHDVGVNLFLINEPEIVGKTYGGSDQASPEVFEPTIRATLAVIFIDGFVDRAAVCKEAALVCPRPDAKFKKDYGDYYYDETSFTHKVSENMDKTSDSDEGEHMLKVICEDSQKARMKIGPGIVRHVIFKKQPKDEAAYHLELPATTKIHHVFHVSQFKKSLKPAVPTQELMLALSEELELQVQLEEVRKLRTLTNGQWEVLIKWTELQEFESTADNFDVINQQFPHFNLEDKVKVVGEGIDGPAGPCTGPSAKIAQVYSKKEGMRTKEMGTREVTTSDTKEVVGEQ